MREIVKEWLHKAEKDFNVARQLLEADNPDSYDMICFLSQQSVEKLMKTLLLCHNRTFPKTHNLEDLNFLLVEIIPNLQFNMDDLLFLTRGAVEFRYPGEEATKEDAVEAFSICKRLRKQLFQLIPVNQ